MTVRKRKMSKRFGLMSGEGGVRSTGKEKSRRGRGCERLRLVVLEKVRDTYTGVWVLCSERSWAMAVTSLLTRKHLWK